MGWASLEWVLTSTAATNLITSHTIGCSPSLSSHGLSPYSVTMDLKVLFKKNFTELGSVLGTSKRYAL